MGRRPDRRPQQLHGGHPIWGTLVALQVKGTAVVGVAHAPALGETYDAAAGAGARCNGETIRVDPAGTLSDATVLFSSVTPWGDAGMQDRLVALLGSARRSRGFGDFWGHALVARGAAHVMAEPDLSVWDVAALQPIVWEAGGAISGLDGRPWAGGGCVTTNGVLHQDVLAALGGT